MATLQRAIELAVQAHKDQEDPPGEPYILHPMRVMLSLPEDDHPLRAVGILHDAVERGSLTLKRLRQERFAKDVIRGVELMTHAKEMPHSEYIVRLKKHRLARAVKLADLKDNSNLLYVEFRASKAQKDKKRVVRYALSYEFLTDRISEATFRRLMKDQES
jgi:(p)ppGpp synthase/HD superfamily hydrolase